MVTLRPYNTVLPLEDALFELGRCAGTQFDPAVVGAFSAAVRDLARTASARI
jgi:HD-GYP domain-containing protein (c-di-GMP phosphodiesterase class II)